jgi:glutamate 5-kinase
VPGVVAGRGVGTATGGLRTKLIATVLSIEKKADLVRESAHKKRCHTGK